MAALFIILFTMVQPGDATVLPLPAHFELHHLAVSSISSFLLGGAPAHLGTFMFSLFTTLVCIAVFAWFFRAYHARLHLEAAGAVAPPSGRPRRIKRSNGRRLSAAEWAEIPFVPGTTKPCSVTADGKVCNGFHRHAKCTLLPAARAEKARLRSEKAARIAMLNDVRQVYPDPYAVAPVAPVAAADHAADVTWYAVAAGRDTGVFTSWATVEPLVTGFSGALHKGFANSRQAEKWLAEARRQLDYVRRSNAAFRSAATAEARTPLTLPCPIAPFAVGAGIPRKLMVCAGCLRVCGRRT
jgi:hypothetical protein